MSNTPASNRLRIGRYSQTGHLYLVTTVTKDRYPVFHSLAAARRVILAMRREHLEGRVETLAFVLMPDHLHWLFEITGTRTLSRIVQAVKSVAAHELGREIWQDGFHDHALRREEDVLKLARYIVANPLRAGLVRHLGDYPHWDAKWL